MPRRQRRKKAEGTTCGQPHKLRSWVPSRPWRRGCESRGLIRSRLKKQLDVRFPPLLPHCSSLRLSPLPNSFFLVDLICPCDRRIWRSQCLIRFPPLIPQVRTSSHLLGISSRQRCLRRGMGRQDGSSAWRSLSCWVTPLGPSQGNSSHPKAS